jgi:type I restriction enzyme S subunit
VPKGWEYDQLGNFITVKRGGSPRPIKDFVVEEGLHWTKISDATSENSPFIMTTKEFIKEEGLKKTVLLEKGSLILSNSATPGLPKFLNINACIHDGWLYFPETEHFTDHYLYHLFVEIRKALVAKGSGTVFTNLKTSILRNYDVVVPNEELVMKFTNNTQSIFAALLKNREETDTITKLRDTLLPKLISGEVGV